MGEEIKRHVLGLNSDLVELLLGEVHDIGLRSLGSLRRRRRCFCLFLAFFWLVVDVKVLVNVVAIPFPLELLKLLVGRLRVQRVQILKPVVTSTEVEVLELFVFLLHYL